MKRGRRVTIRDLAADLGLSTATVSTALTGRRNGVFLSERTRERVWKTARRRGYAFERPRKPPRNCRVAVLSPPAYDSLLLNLMMPELTRRLCEKDFHVEIHMDCDRRKLADIARELYRQHKIDAAIFIGSRRQEDGLEFGEIPSVIIGDVPPEAKVWRVGIDNEAGGRLLGEHLWELGHRQVAMVFAESNLVPGIKRLGGLRSVWHAHGQEVPGRNILRLRNETSAELTENLPGFMVARVHGPGSITALFCYTDRLAAMALKVLRRMNLRVPDDISVVGFDDNPYADLLDPPLTTIHQPFSEMGATAAQLLDELLSNGEQSPRELLLPCQLVVRASTAAMNPESVSKTNQKRR